MQAAAILILVRPCIKCSATERDKNGNCRACSRAAAKKWYEANKDKAKARMLAWHKSNPEKSKATQDAWRRANPEKVKAASKRQSSRPETKLARAAYYQANMDKFKASAGAWRAANQYELRIHQQNNRARELGADGQLSRGLVGKLLKLQQGLCPCCRKPLGEDFETDHITALSRGGENSDFNIQLLRAECNRDKFTKHPIDFMQERGLLI